MKNVPVWIILTICVFLIVTGGTSGHDKGMVANKYKTISATACDSLIKANSKNPDFVILDVRTPSVWTSDHLAGSINRNFYDADFSSQLNALPKNKIYLLHCQSGGRSGPTLALMKTQNFSEVYEMSGGINAWKAASFSTTAVMAPKIMLVSTDPRKKVTMNYGRADTLQFTITNRANDTLKFASVTLPAGAEFSSNFDLKRKLKGSEDYTFSVFYKPLQLSKDSLKVGIRSNGGDLTLGIFVKSQTVYTEPSLAFKLLAVFPNPTKGIVSIWLPEETVFQELSLFDSKGRVLINEVNFNSGTALNLSNFSNGIYFLRLVVNNRHIVKTVVLNR